MPITKIPISHKFGIISQSQREDLQERLLKQATSPSRLSDNRHHATRNPLELSDAFIEKFNSATSLDEKESLEDVARKLLSRAKRRAGLLRGASGSNVDLPKAWAELSMLAQCRGKIQEECLDTLIVSLHQAPLSQSFIPCLFYLGETTLYWLRTDAMNQPFLRIGEIKLLKMGQTVFVRLFYHHMVGHLRGHSDFKERLATYLTGFTDTDEAYGPYPSAHLCLKYIMSVGKMIAGEVLMKTPPPDSVHQAQTTDTGYDATMNINPTDKPLTPTSPPNSVIQLKEVYAEQQLVAPQDAPQLLSPPVPSSIHDLSPSLWHALDVWRCSDHLAEGVADSIEALALCASRIATEHWVDASCALRIVGEAALNNLSVLRALQNLAKGRIPPPKHIPVTLADQPVDLIEEEKVPSPIHDNSRTSPESMDSMEIKFEEMLGIRAESGGQTGFIKKQSQLSNLSAKKGFSRESQMKSNRNTSMCVMIDTPQVQHAESLPSAGNKTTPGTASPASLPDISSRESQLDSAGGLGIWEHRIGSAIQEDDVDSDLAPGDDSLVTPRPVDVTQVTDTQDMSSNIDESKDKPPPSPEKVKREVSFDLIPTDEPKRKSSLRGPSVQANGLHKSASAKSVVIDPVPSTTFYSEQSDNISEDNTKAEKALPEGKKVPDQRGIITWPWEVAYIYTYAMATICLYGKTAEIKKRALIGDRGSSSQLMSKSKDVISTGILDLTEFGSDKPESHCWYIRYAAISGLVKISRCFQDDQTMDGMRTVVWNALMVRHSKETDERVLEAFRVGQVEAQVECEMQKAALKHSLNFRLAAGLSSNYLPPLPPPVAPVKRFPRKNYEPPKPTVPLNKGTTRPSLKDEIKLATALPKQQISFYSRTDLDLKRIVEDQWRKELHEQLEEEEKERRNQEEANQKLQEKES